VPFRLLERALKAVDPSWAALLEETRKPYFRELWAAVESESALAPAVDDVFRAFALPLPRVRVVILGQDPYPTRGNAVGRAFAVARGLRAPNSLRNIFQEVERCCGARPADPTLGGWQDQGVLLLNVCLTTRAGSSHAHKGRGWETFTDRAIELVNGRPEPVVFMLWGRPAREKKALLTNPAHAVLETAHPSFPYQGFRGCGHFRAANEFLEKAGARPIDWTRA